MKFLILSLAFISLSVSAATIKMNSNRENPIPGSEKLTEVPQNLLGTLMDAGIPLKAAGKETFQLVVNNFHCDYNSRSAYEGSVAGIGTYSCRINKKKVSEGRAIVNILGQVEADERVFFTDCGMGKCTVDVKKIVCTVDTKIEVFSEGRFSCELTDTME